MQPRVCHLRTPSRIHDNDKNQKRKKIFYGLCILLTRYMNRKEENYKIFNLFFSQLNRVLLKGKNVIAIIIGANDPIRRNVMEK